MTESNTAKNTFTFKTLLRHYAKQVPKHGKYICEIGTQMQVIRDGQLKDTRLTNPTTPYAISRTNTMDYHRPYSIEYFKCESPSRGLLHDYKTLNNLREGSLEALVSND